MMRRFFAVTVWVLLTAFLCPAVLAQTTPAGPEAKKKLEAWKARLNQSLKAEQSVLRQLYTIETEQRRQQMEVEKISAKMGEIRSSAVDAEARIEALKVDKEKRAARINATLRR